MRSLSIDILKIILSFFVVFLHMHVLRDSYPSLSYVLVNGLFRIAVPVFLIITGYYFFYIDTRDKLRKWLIRIFLLYAIWTVVYIPFWKDDRYVLNILFGYHHLWYLIGTFFSGIILFNFRKKSACTLFIAILILFCIGYSLQ
ncbi:acyltransferase family protein, partial [Chryseobacterium sp.]|uniref:acyltransferase family protein n=1 Tax=Chryseobacterium sp. TaxID=1871047 RepID=UPI00341DECAC